MTKKTPILTIGMANHDDYSGVWFTIQAMRIYHADVMDEVEFLLLDNSPHTAHGEANQKYMRTLRNQGHYLPVSSRKSTSLRNMVVDAANTEYVMCVDSHVFLAEGSLKKLIRFLHMSKGCPDLFQGPLRAENGNIVGTHMNPAFRGRNFGTWGTMQDLDWNDPNLEPFLIPGHGMGLWVCRRDNWPHFHHAYRAFGGEEMIIHEKYRQAGMHCWCLPFLMWNHRFGHVGGANYPNTDPEKYRNFMIGFHETGLPLSEVESYFSTLVADDRRQTIREEVAKIFPGGPKVLPPDYKPFLGYPLRINDQSRKDSEDYREFERPVYDAPVYRPDANLQQV